jgi:hypothetical protein
MPHLITCDAAIRELSCRSEGVSSRYFILDCQVEHGSCSTPCAGGFGGEPAGHEVDHREVDHGFGSVRMGFVVAGRATVVHQSTQRPFDCPSAWQNGKSRGGGVAADDVHVDAESGGVFDEVLAVATRRPRSWGP